VEHLSVSIKERIILFQGYICVEEALIDFKDEKGTILHSSKRTAVLRGDAVGALLYCSDSKTLIMVEQYRYPVHRFNPETLIEIPAGMIDPGETPHASMQREILEETGYQARQVKFVQTFFISPGISSERLHLFFAQVNTEDKIQKGGGLDTEAEHIHVIHWSEDRALEALFSGKIRDGKTLIALQWFFYKN
jgi:nudix-type nucleoside diphosphatase (YffH/AdpP family)